MFIRQLKIEDFRSHRSTELELERITVIRGPNAAGKSSIEEAIAFLLTGRTESTGDNGQGAAALIRQGAAKAVITANFADDEVRMRASLTEKGGRSISMKPEGALPPAASRDVLSCLCSTRYFSHMNAAAQKDFLSRVVIPEEAKLPVELIAAMDEAKIIGTGRHPLDVIDSAYQEAFARRTEANRALKAWQEPAKPQEDSASVDEVRTRLKQRQDERAALIQKRNGISAQGEEWDARESLIQKRIAENRARLESEEHQLSTARQSMLSDSTAKKYAKAAQSRQRQEAIAAEFAELNVRRNTILALGEALTALEDKGSCPTCQQAVTQGHVDAIIAPLERETTTIAERITALSEESKSLGDWADAARKLQSHKHAVDDTKRMETRVADLRTNLTAAERDLAELGARPSPEESITELDVQIGDLDVRIERGMEAHVRAAGAKHSHDVYEKAMQERRRLEARIAQLNLLVEQLGANGIKATLIETYFGGFQYAMNAVLSAWSYQVALIFEPYSFQVNGREYRLLSKSERLRFGIAFQMALAVVSGVRMVVIDEIDMLDTMGRKTLMRSLMTADEIEQAILLGTDERTETPDAPGTIFYMLTAEAEGHTGVHLLRHTPSLEVANA